jgi:hypothetical protein
MPYKQRVTGSNPVVPTKASHKCGAFLFKSIPNNPNIPKQIKYSVNKRIIYYFFFLLLLTDLSYSFVQHLSMPLDGDMAGGIVPAQDVKPVLHDPFGISVITENAIYPNPNRFFAHWTFFNYFNYVPLWLQHLVDPIDSVYLACAIAKIVIQILILTLLALYITGKQKILNTDFLLAALLIVPLFQTNGYRSYMGIIDPSITYTFFYALPCALLLLFYFPFFSDSIFGTALLKRKLVTTGLFALAIFIVFNGALNPGIILTITLLFGLNYFLETDKNLPFNKKISQAIKLAPKTHLFFFSFIGILSLYAIYIGFNNSIFLGETTTISERYSRIPMGIFYMLTQKIGFPLLLIVIAINIFLLRRNRQEEAVKKLLGLFMWIGLFSLFFILLLPLGGYKEYRPNVLRYDTIMPITTGLIFIYGASAYQLIKLFKGQKRNSYLAVIIIFTFIFSNADKPELNKNDCEKSALTKISKSDNKVVFVDNDCTVLSWDKITDPKESALNGQLLNKWRITKDTKLYFQNK